MLTLQVRGGGEDDLGEPDALGHDAVRRQRGALTRVVGHGHYLAVGVPAHDAHREGAGQPLAVERVQAERRHVEQAAEHDDQHERGGGRPQCVGPALGHHGGAEQQQPQQGEHTGGEDDEQPLQQPVGDGRRGSGIGTLAEEAEPAAQPCPVPPRHRGHGAEVGQHHRPHRGADVDGQVGARQQPRRSPGERGHDHRYPGHDPGERREVGGEAGDDPAPGVFVPGHQSEQKRAQREHDHGHGGPEAGSGIADRVGGQRGQRHALVEPPGGDAEHESGSEQDGQGQHEPPGDAAERGQYFARGVGEVAGVAPDVVEFGGSVGEDRFGVALDGAARGW